MEDWGLGAAFELEGGGVWGLGLGVKLGLKPGYVLKLELVLILGLKPRCVMGQEPGCALERVRGLSLVSTRHRMLDRARGLVQERSLKRGRVLELGSTRSHISVRNRLREMMS